MNELQQNIKNMEHIELISQQVQQLKKKLAWAWVYDVDKQLQQQSTKLEKLKERIPACQAKIDEQSVSNKPFVAGLPFHYLCVFLSFSLSNQ